MGDKLIVALNSDKWLENKKGKFFMPYKERNYNNLSMVDEVISFEDDNSGSATNALIKVKQKYPNDEIAFLVEIGNSKNIPEMSVDGVKFLFSVGGDDKKIPHHGY